MNWWMDMVDSFVLNFVCDIEMRKGVNWRMVDSFVLNYVYSLSRSSFNSAPTSL